MAAATKPNIFKRLSRRLVDYCKAMGEDYKNSIKDAYTDSKAQPIKTSIIATALASLGYAYHTNPTEIEMRDHLAELRQQMVLVPNAIHNRKTGEIPSFLKIQNGILDAELEKRTLLSNQRRLVYYDCYFFSLLVQRPYDRKVSFFKTNSE